MSQREPDSEPERARESRTASQREPEWARGSQIRLECEPERARKRQSELERLWADVAFYCTLGSLFGRQITKERLDTHLACLNIVLLQNSFKYDSVLSRNVKIRYFLSRNVKISAMSRKNGTNYATSWLRIFSSPDWRVGKLFWFRTSSQTLWPVAMLFCILLMSHSFN